jgi:hypothetical protein
MAQRNSGYRRLEGEAYQTSAHWVIAALRTQPEMKNIALAWDPCPPTGLVTEAWHALGVSAIGTDDDFLTRTEAPPGVSHLTTNPPYGPKKRGELARAFIEHALELGVSCVAMLLRNDFDSAVTRQHLFRYCPSFAFKLVLLNRIRWFAGPNSPSDNHAWFCWHHEHEGPPTVRYVSKIESVEHGEDDMRAKLPLTSHLTRGYSPELEQQIRTSYPGQAHFGNSGPFGRTCGECASLGYYKRIYDNAGNCANTTKVGGCKKFHQLTGQHGAIVPPNAPACKYFEPKQAE